MPAGFQPSASGKTIDKVPSAILDYGFTLAEWLDGDSVSTVTPPVWSVSELAASLVVESSSVLPGNQIIKVWLSGGTVGKTYTVLVTFSTMGGRKDTLHFYVRIVALKPY